MFSYERNFEADLAMMDFTIRQTAQSSKRITDTDLSLFAAEGG
jgi:hypothetical protein